MNQGVKLNIKHNKSYFMTLTVEGWIDVFSREMYRQIIIESMRHCIREKGLNIYSYVIMSNHIHLIANANEPFQLSDTIRDFKKFTSKACIAQMRDGAESRRSWLLSFFSERALQSSRHKDFKFWQTGNHAIELYYPKFVWDKVNYIHQNPVRAGLVAEPQHYLYSSATNYMELDSKLPEVIRITPYLNYGMK